METNFDRMMAQLGDAFDSKDIPFLEKSTQDPRGTLNRFLIYWDDVWWHANAKAFREATLKETLPGRKIYAFEIHYPSGEIEKKDIELIFDEQQGWLLNLEAFIPVPI